MLRRSLFILLVAAFASSASATTIIFSSSMSGRSAVDASLTPLPDGDLFLVGMFSNVGGITLGSTAAAVLASGGWSQFAGTNATTTIPVGNSGKLTGQAQDNTASAAPFNQQNLYLVIFNKSTSASASQMGIFRAPANSVGNAWVFPTNAGGGTDSINISMNESSMASTGGVGAISPTSFILTTLVPEPTAFVLLGSGILALLGYRRLRRFR